MIALYRHTTDNNCLNINPLNASVALMQKPVN